MQPCMLYKHWLLNCIALLNRHNGLAIETLSCLAKEFHATFEKINLSAMHGRKFCRPLSSVNNYVALAHALLYNVSCALFCVMSLVHT